MSEFIKFRPENIDASQFMRPPTETLLLPVGVQCFIEEDGVNEAAAKVTRSLGYANKARQLRPKLKIGSEIELLCFSDQSVPHLDVQKSLVDNPNYTRSHLQNVALMERALTEDPEDDGLNGLGDVLLADTNRARLFMEIRTSPTDVAGYLHAMGRIQSWFQHNTPRFHVRPVVWSQHLHMSLVDEKNDFNLLGGFQEVNAVTTGLIDIYHRAVPLLRLPENVESDITYDMGRSGYGVKDKNWEPPRRVEGRMTNSDYAFDPGLNLLFHLIGLRRGLEFHSRLDKIDQDYPLKHDSNSPYFIVGGKRMKYEATLDHVVRDEVLEESVPSAILQVAHGILTDYPQISKGGMSVEEARLRAYDSIPGRARREQIPKNGNLSWPDRVKHFLKL